MKNHFLRRKLKHTERLATPLESLVYENTPGDQLVVRDEIVARVRSSCERHPENGRYSGREIEGAVASLAARTFIREVYGPALEKLITQS